MSAAWWEGPLAGFDLETTSADPEEARIVTASLVIDEPGCTQLVYEWLVDPGVEIPEEAAGVHGITTEMARERGADASQAFGQILDRLLDIAPMMPLVIYNAQYDLTVVDRESRRHRDGKPGVGVNGWPWTVVDPYVLDKQMARYRRGSRKLDAVSAVYGVKLVDAHNSTADVKAAIGIVRAMGRLSPFPPVDELHQRQAGWKREQQTSLEDYFRRQGTLTEPVTKDWPVIPFGEVES